MTGAAGDGPDTAGTDPLTAVVAEAISAHESYDEYVRSPAKVTTIVLTCRCGDNFTDPDDHQGDTNRYARWRGHRAAGVVAAVRAHQNTTGQHTAARALRDAADFTAEFWGEPVGVHIADWLRNRADTLELS